MGGSLSHEYQYPAAIGENNLLSCSKCDYAANTDISGDIRTCPKCQTEGLATVKGIEVFYFLFSQNDFEKKNMKEPKYTNI